MRIIGITGGTGSGKTTALNILEALGARVIDCDRLYHELLEESEEMKAELGESFPDAVADGVVDRKKLGAIVFSYPDSLKRLNAITHKYVGREVDRIIDTERRNGRKAVAIDAIALIESGISKACDTVIAITAPEERRIERIMKREGISKEYAKLRVGAQKTQEWYEANCDMILDNSGTVEEFEALCTEKFKALI